MVERMAEITTKLDSGGKRDPTLPTDGIPEGFVKCYGNQVFKCNKGCHPKVKCKHSSTYYKELRESVTNHGYNKERTKPSLKKLIHKLDWYVYVEENLEFPD